MAQEAPASPSAGHGHVVAEPPLLGGRELRAAYGRRIVLDDVTLEVRRGEVVGLVGPNGAGKSTLVRVLAGLLPVQSGTVRLDGRPLAAYSRRAVARQIAVVPQEAVFGFPFSVLQVVLMGRHPHLSGARFESADDLRLAREALSRCGVAHLEERSIFELSAGERQRVVFARALVQQPQGLLLDEPASFLDLRHQVELYDRVRELASDPARRTAVLTILHDLNLAAEYCDRLYLLKQGRVYAAGATDEVLTYANLKAVFDTEVYVDRNHLTGKLLIAPLSSRARERLGRC